MMMAIIFGEDTPGQTEVLYRSDVKGWHMDSIYTLSINYQPSINSLALSMMKDGTDLWSQTWDKTFTQPKIIGKIGVFAHSQEIRLFDSTVQQLCVI